MSAHGGDPGWKAAIRCLYGAALGVHAMASIVTSGRHGQPRVFYGGARGGDIGGPLVKVQRLREYFPERRWTYNLVYCLSNAAYLPDFAIDSLKRRRIPIVHNQNGVFYPGWFGGDWRAQNARMARTYHAADHVFWQSEFCRRSAERYLGFRRGPGEILYNSVDTNLFSPSSRKRHEAPLVFLATGKFDAHLYYRLSSTFDGFAAAVRHGLDARLRIAGWMAPEVEKTAVVQASSLGIAERIEFCGPYTQVQAPEIYRSADIYVMTKHNDPCPSSVIEALACGLPVVYSASGGVAELVGDAGASVAVPEDWERAHVPSEDDLAAAMLDVAGRLDVLSGRARNRAVERFDIGHWIERHRQVFTALTA